MKMTDKQIVIVRDGEKYYLGHGHEKEVFNFPEKKPQLHSLQQIETDLSSLDSVRRTVYREKIH